MEKSLSLCMIVKNEEQFIGKCLDSVKHIVDEMIIVDTGSTDHTVSICQSYGAKVFEIPWTENFADARNYGLSQATGDWILWMDADEQLDQDTAMLIRDILTEEEAHIGLIQLINYVGEGLPNLEDAYIVAHHRLIRNNKGFAFKGAIHERLNVQEVVGEEAPMKVIPAKIHHYGYLETVVRDRNKSDRNLRLLEKEKSKSEYSPWVDYHIANEFHRLKRYHQAYDAVNLSLKNFIEAGQLPPSLLYRLKYELMLTMGNYEVACQSIEKAISLYTDYVDLHFYRGVILFLKQSYAEAIPVFLHCLELGEGNIHHLTRRGVGSFHAWYYVGKCLEHMDKRDEAVEAYKECLQGCTDHKEASEALEQLLKKPKSMQQDVTEDESTQITISLCMIVRDEEGSLARCLDCVEGIADEIVIVDTGSIDKTKEIAEKYGAKIYDFTWIDDFSAARNYAFSKATQKYILWLDADDVIESKDRALFKELKQSLSPNIDSVTMPYVLMVDEKGEPTWSLRRNRLVRRACRFLWHGPVHEYLAVAGQTIHSDVCITHKKDKEYSDRNLQIYEKRLASGEEFSPRDLYYYANELRDNARYEEATIGYAKFLDTGQGWIEDNIQACKKMSECFGKINEEQEQFMALLRSFTYDKPRAEICCALGALWAEKGCYTQAIYWYEQATQLPADQNHMSVVEPSSWTWLPHLQLCVCYDRLRDVEKAYHHHKLASAFNPSHPSMEYNKKYFEERLGKH
jgi:glycosyltransferase involved in cell wall biosynthesis